MDSESGHVYIMECMGTGRVKIGFSNDPERRLKELSQGSSTQIRLVCKMCGDKQMESRLHERFFDSRVMHLSSREWFGPSRALRAFVASQGGTLKGDPEPSYSELREDLDHELKVFRDHMEDFHGLVHDVITVIRQQSYRTNYRHTTGRRAGLSGTFVDDVRHARKSLRPLVEQVKAEEAKRMLAIVEA